MPVREKPEDRKKRAMEILKILKKTYPRATTALNWAAPLELLVATILSAQCTDTRVNIVTKDLFKKYRAAGDYISADPAELEQMVRTCGFYRQKTKSIKHTCRMIVDKFSGKVPDTMEELITLPGVARKTANVVLGAAFGKNEGIAVDTHVGRVTMRLGLITSTTDPKNAVKIEHDLMELIPRKNWTFFSHGLVLHGREICHARKPEHDKCPLNKLCPNVNTQIDRFYAARSFSRRRTTDFS
ncbi:MAG: endonuclease III [Phycisphaerae bacterium]